MTTRCAVCEAERRLSDIRELSSPEELAFFSTRLGQPLIQGMLVCRFCLKSFNCMACTKRPKRGRWRTLHTAEDVSFFSQRLGVDLTIGGQLCDRCRRKREADALDSDVEDLVQHGEAEDFGEGVPMDVDAYVSDTEPNSPIVIYPVPRPSATNRWCLFCKDEQDRRVIPLSIRRSVFNRARIYIPPGRRVCGLHQIDFETSVELLKTIPTIAETSSIPEWEVKFFLSDSANSSLWDEVFRGVVDDYRLKSLIGLNNTAFVDLVDRLTTLRSSSLRNVNQAVFVFLYKLRTGNSDELIAANFNLPRRKAISDIFKNVMGSFETVVAEHFGPQSLSRRRLLDNVSVRAKKILTLTDDQVALILDGTYIRHQKSSNNAYQRRSYSGQKKVPLCKPFTVCTTNGFIVDLAGPFAAKRNDAAIVKEVLKMPTLRGLLRDGDVLIVDRGFRDALNFMTDLGFKVLMPAMLNKRKQLPTDEANQSRRVTMVRWVVEAIHGHLWGKFKLLKHTVDNKMLPKMQKLCGIVGFLQNTYGTRLATEDSSWIAEQLDHMETRMQLPNTLREEVEAKHWNRRASSFGSISEKDLTDFPIMTEDSLILFTSGPYQIRMARSYLAELIGADNEVRLRYVKLQPTIIRVEIQSRHSESVKYRVYVEYEPRINGVEGIKRYYCECKNGARTLGCCSHVATIVYYLSHARWQLAIPRPAHQLTDLFIPEDSDSEEDADETAGPSRPRDATTD